jgi:dipeptidyl aminopeptidase/acylaminoacyl peptidase
VYQDEGHGWTQPATRVDFWKRVENFLGRHIGPGTAR